MYDMTDVDMADRLAGGPRDDLDDVFITDPVQVNPQLHRVPAGVPLLEWLRARTEEHETVEVFKRFYENPDGLDWDVIAKRIQAARAEADAQGPRAVTHMYLEYAADLYRRCPHLSMVDVWEHLRELGFPHSRWAVYRYFNRNEISSRERSAAASNYQGSKS